MKKLLLAAAGLACAALFGAAMAQYPSKPIKIVVPFPAGSATDTVARILGGPVSAALGQPIVVDNKAGADGMIAGQEVAKAAPDGYTIFLATNSPLSAVPAMKNVVPYDPVRDFTPITDVGRYTFFLYVNSTLPVKTLGELIAYAKANPGKLNYATGNTTAIVSTAQLLSLGGIDMLWVPYKGEPAGVTDLIAGRVQVMFATLTTGGPHVKDGKLRALATSLGARSAAMPEVPTMAEAGMPKFSITSWAGLFGPAKLPREIVERLNREFVAAMKRPEVVAAMDKQAFLLSPSTPEALAAFVKEQREAYARSLAAVGWKKD